MNFKAESEHKNCKLHKTRKKNKLMSCYWYIYIILNNISIYLHSMIIKNFICTLIFKVSG